MDIEYQMFSDKGDRELNEDYIGRVKRDGGLLFALADGLGGHGKGEVASNTVVNTIMHLYIEQEQKPTLEECMDYAQTELLRQQKIFHETQGMKTTLVLLEIADGKARWAHIGDSRLYLFQNGRMKLRTFDHSVPQMLVEMGEIRERDIRGHEDRNRLLKVMGTDWTKPQYEVSDWLPIKSGYAFLLCSDGFWELITEKDMGKLMRHSVSVDRWLEKMCVLVKKHGEGKNMDNFSAIAVGF